jgi:hypothetical protein
MQVLALKRRTFPIRRHAAKAARGGSSCNTIKKGGSGRPRMAPRMRELGVVPAFVHAWVSSWSAGYSGS